MKSKRSDLLIAFGVIACSLILLGALTVALTGWRPTKIKRSLIIDYPDVTGIRMHSPVRYAGAPAGSVVGIRLLSDEERIASGGVSTVRVTLELYDSLPLLPDDIRATLSSDTLLSDKFVALSAGSADHPKLANGAILKGSSAAGLDSLINAVGPLVESVDSLVAQLSKTLTGFDTVVVKTGAAVDTFREGMADALPRVSKLADSLKGTADSATSAVSRIDKLVADADPLIQADLKKLSAALGDLQKALGSADKLFSGTDRQIDGRMEELSVVLQNLKVLTTQAKSFTKAIGEKPNRIIFSGKMKDLPSEQEILRSKKPVPVP